MSDHLLEIKDLHIRFQDEIGVVKAVNGVSLSMRAGETLGVVGESGCGKSVTALSVLQLIQCPPGRYAGGEIWFKGVDLLTKEEKYMRSIRGNDISMIFQEPMTSLNPAYTVGRQISESLVLHRRWGKQKAAGKALEMLRLVGIPAPEKRLNEYPHEMSGGMRQRVMIAMALCCDPDLLIADEPTTALDVTIQAQILELMKRFKKEIGMAIMLISHDLGVIAEVSDRVVIFYSGKVVEYADMRAVFKRPKHPYTVGLHRSRPRIEDDRGTDLFAIEGNIPNPWDMPPGCEFHPRCEHRMDICSRKEPALKQVGEGHLVRCWMYDPEHQDLFNQ